MKSASTTRATGRSGDHLYTYTVGTTGTTPLTNVLLTDNNGTPGTTIDDFHPTYISGDTNLNGVLDRTETWTYSATHYVTVAEYNAAMPLTSTVTAQSGQTTGVGHQRRDGHDRPAPGSNHPPRAPMRPM